MMAETKMKPVAWMERPRANRLASIMWPGLADEQARREMDYLSKQEGKRSPVEVRGGISKSVTNKGWR
jgi:hypothetical protein